MGTIRVHRAKVRHGRVGKNAVSACLRGGSWFSKPRNLRSANRSWLSTGNRNNLSGFRIARTLTP